MLMLPRPPPWLGRPDERRAESQERQVMNVIDAAGEYRSGGWRRPAWTRDGERVGIYLLITILIGWIIAMLAIQFVLVAQHGYGLAWTNKPHVPAAIVKQIGVGDNIKAMQKATNKP